jgi:hypothetical protein
MIARAAVTTAVAAEVATTIVPRARLAVLVVMMLLLLARKPAAAVAARGCTRIGVTIIGLATMGSASERRPVSGPRVSPFPVLDVVH